MDRVKKLIHCRDAFALGITGRGVGVAVLDTGIFLHRDMENRVTAFADMVGHRRAPYEGAGLHRREDIREWLRAAA